jgi:hypothetical protein
VRKVKSGGSIIINGIEVTIHSLNAVSFDKISRLYSSFEHNIRSRTNREKAPHKSDNEVARERGRQRESGKIHPKPEVKKGTKYEIVTQEEKVSEY